MALGGGTWLTQNKKLPGYYHNVISRQRATANISDRGIAAAPFKLSWGEVGKVFLVERNEFYKNSMKIFGYAYTAPEMWALREIFKHAMKVYCYRLGATVDNTATAQEGDVGEPITNGHSQASCTYATARYPGKRGNDIKLLISNDIDNEKVFIVKTLVGGSCFDTQKVETYAELKDNDWVLFDKSNDTALAINTGMNLEGGLDGEPTGLDYQNFLAAIEPYNFHSLCCPTDDETTVSLFAQTTESQRDEFGVKYQLVAWHSTANYEGVINVWNEATHSTINVPENASVYWVAGTEAACAINKTLTNTKYDGELNINVDYKQAQLEEAIDKGRFMFHNVNGEVRVLEDINTFTETTDTKGDDFKSNQTIRVVDQISNDMAVLFNNRYLGKVQNDAIGRGALWNDFVCYFKELERLRTVEGFDPEIIICELGDNKKSVETTVNGLYIVNAMSQLYMTTVII